MEILRKDQLESSLSEEKRLIQDGRLKDPNPLDTSNNFNTLCQACRKGDLKTCQEVVARGVNINARDLFDYTPLILASLCGHYEVVQYLLELGALCERDTFQGERCLYNALNDRIRNLLLSYDYHKSADPLQPFASHITSLLTRDTPRTSDVIVTLADESFRLHKFILSSRSLYFSRKLRKTSDTTLWKISAAIPPPAFSIAMRFIYLGEIPSDVGGGPGSGYSESEILEGIDRISKQLEIRSLWDGILESDNRRLRSQRKSEELEKGRTQLHDWFRENVLKHKVSIDAAEADDVRWDWNNAIFADVLLRADEPDVAAVSDEHQSSNLNGVPVGPNSFTSQNPSRAPSQTRGVKKSILFPVHRAMLIRSEFFCTMFSSPFRESQPSAHVPVIPVDCSPEVLEIVLTYLYAEKSDFPLEVAIDVLLAADLLLIEKLKLRAAVIISTLGSGSSADSLVGINVAVPEEEYEHEHEHEVINVYDVLRAGWLTRVPRLEEFAARYFAYRLETYIDEEEFAEVIRESAGRIRKRQETDSIELLDEIRYYLSERFRLRFEDAGLETLMNSSPPPPPPSSLNATPTPTPIRMSKAEAEAATAPAADIPWLAPTTTGGEMGVGEDEEERKGGNEEEGDGKGGEEEGEGDGEGEEEEDEAKQYSALMAKIEILLGRLGLDA